MPQSQDPAILTLLKFLGALGLYAFGVRTVRHFLQARGEKLFDWALGVTESSPNLLGPVMGVFTASLFQAPGSLGLMLVGLVNAGLYKVRQARAMAIGLPWSSVILAIFLSMPLSDLALAFSGPAALAWLFWEERPFGNWGKGFLGFSLFYLSIDLGVPLASHLTAIVEPNELSVLFLSTIMGISALILSMIIRSQIYAPFLAYTLCTGSSEFIIPSWCLILGAGLGLSIGVFTSSRETKVEAQRVALGMLLPQAVVSFATLPFLTLLKGFSVQAFPFIPELALVLGWVIISFIAVIFSSSGEFIWSKIVTRGIPDAKIKEVNQLSVLGNSIHMMPSTTLVQAELANEKFADIVTRMFGLTREYLHQKAKWPRMLTKIKNYERVTDNLQKESTQFLCTLTEKELTQNQSVRVQVALRVADELESVADYLDKLATGFTHVSREGGLKNSELHELYDLFDKVYAFYQTVIDALNEDIEIDYDTWRVESDRLRTKSENLRSDTANKADRGELKAGLSLAYSDMIVALRKIRSHTHNIAQALSRLN